MRRFQTGRLDRSHYWALVVGLFASKAVLLNLIGAGPTAAVSMLLVFLLVSARFHDFGGPSGLAAALLLLVYGSVFAALLVAALSGDVIRLDTPEALLSMPLGYALAILVPEPLLLLLAGTISGNAAANAYGPARQGFAGWLPRPAAAKAVSGEAGAGRVSEVVGRIGTYNEPASSEFIPTASRRTAGPSFGRR